MGEKLSSQGQRFVWSRAAASLLLLALTTHAFVAGATHFHRAVPPGAFLNQALLQSGEGRGQDAPLGGEEKQCLLCRLQRNLVADLQHTTLVIAPPPAGTPAHELLHDTAARTGAALLRQGRAPPFNPVLT